MQFVILIPKKLSPLTPLTQSPIVVTDSEWNVEKSVLDKSCTCTCEGRSGPKSTRAQSLSKTEVAAATTLTAYNL